jgi:hypothetical protein
MIKLRRLCSEACLNVAQAFPIGKLCERHGTVLLGTRKCSHVSVVTITRHEPCEAGNPLVERTASFRFMGGPSQEKGLANRRQLQINTTENRQISCLLMAQSP